MTTRSLPIRSTAPARLPWRPTPTASSRSPSFSTADDKISPAEHVAKSLAAVEQLASGKPAAR